MKKPPASLATILTAAACGGNLTGPQVDDRTPGAPTADARVPDVAAAPDVSSLNSSSMGCFLNPRVPTQSGKDIHYSGNVSCNYTRTQLSMSIAILGADGHQY